jgi:GTPase SAR1 family protein
VTLVGDKATSKTTILKSFAQDATKDLSGVFEAVSYPITITGVKDKYILRLFDTDPDELFSRIRAITYKTTDIFVICFDLTNEDTFKNCRSWYAEVNQLSSKSPVLVRALPFFCHLCVLTCRSWWGQKWTRRTRASTARFPSRCCRTC